MLRYRLRKLLFWQYGFSHYNWVFWQIKTRFWNRTNSPANTSPKDVKNRLRYYNWETGWTLIGTPTPDSRAVVSRVEDRTQRAFSRILWSNMELPR